MVRNHKILILSLHVTFKALSSIGIHAVKWFQQMVKSKYSDEHGVAYQLKCSNQTMETVFGLS